MSLNFYALKNNIFFKKLANNFDLTKEHQGMI